MNCINNERAFLSFWLENTLNSRLNLNCLAMARGGKSRGGKSSNKFGGRKNFNKKSAYKKPATNRYLMVKKQIERNKESEEILKRQQLGEY